VRFYPILKPDVADDPDPNVSAPHPTRIAKVPPLGALADATVAVALFVVVVDALGAPVPSSGATIALDSYDETSGRWVTGVGVSVASFVPTRAPMVLPGEATYVFPRVTSVVGVGASRVLIGWAESA
jgi:hypothetical protein